MLIEELYKYGNGQNRFLQFRCLHPSVDARGRQQILSYIHRIFSFSFWLKEYKRVKIHSLRLESTASQSSYVLKIFNRSIETVYSSLFMECVHSLTFVLTMLNGL